MKDLYRQKEARTRKLYQTKKKKKERKKERKVPYCKIFFFYRMTGVYQARNLTDIDQVIPDWES